VPVADAAADAAAEAAAEADPDVAGRARRAVAWSWLNTVVGRVGSVVIGVVLARILVPADYGAFAVALIVLNALLSVNELGVSLAVVRWPGDVSRIAPTVVTLSAASSVLLLGAALAAAPWVAVALHAPGATGALRVLSCAVLIDAVTAVPAALMTREFLQRQRMLVDLAGFVVTAGLSVGLAAAGAGVWSLVCSALAGNLVNGALVVAAAPRRYRPGFDRAVARELLGFGAPLALASLLVFALLNVDYVVVGASLDAVQLGFYLLAFNLSTWPVTVFSAPARRVSLPAFARLHADGGQAPGPSRASAAFVPACTALVTATLPACLLLGLLAGPLVGLVYGPTWAPTAAVLPWLMVLAVTRVVGELAYDFLVALDRPRATLAVQAAWLAATAPALVVGAHLGGIVGLAMAHAVVCLTVALPGYALTLSRAGVSVVALLRDLARPGAAAVTALAAGGVAGLLVSSPLALLAVGGTAVALVYLVVARPTIVRSLGLGGA
jgi:PST family polysaccharide transporter